MKQAHGGEFANFIVRPRTWLTAYGEVSVGLCRKEKEQIRIYEGNLKYIFSLMAYSPGETVA